MLKRGRVETARQTNGRRSTSVASVLLAPLAPWPLPPSLPLFLSLALPNAGADGEKTRKSRVQEQSRR